MISDVIVGCIAIAKGARVGPCPLGREGFPCWRFGLVFWVGCWFLVRRSWFREFEVGLGGVLPTRVRGIPLLSLRAGVLGRVARPEMGLVFRVLRGALRGLAACYPGGACTHRRSFHRVDDSLMR